MGSARAGTIEIFGGAPGSEPLGSATNDIIGAQLGYLASNLTATGPGTIQFTFIGYEAGYQNSFLAGDSGGSASLVFQNSRRFCHRPDWNALPAIPRQRNA